MLAVPELEWEAMGTLETAAAVAFWVRKSRDCAVTSFVEGPSNTTSSTLINYAHSPSLKALSDMDSE